jgi:hypothetical protein
MTRPKRAKLPASWDEARVQRVAKHYEQQSQEEATAEDEAAFGGEPATVMRVPAKLVPAVRRLIAKGRVKRSAA